MNHEKETLLPEPNRTPATHRRDLLLARQVIAQLRDQDIEADDPFHVGDLDLDAATLDALWDGLTGSTPTAGMRKAWNGSGAMPTPRGGRHAVDGGWGAELSRKLRPARPQDI